MTEKQFGVGLLNQETFGKQIREMFWVRLSLHTSQVDHQAGAYPGFLRPVSNAAPFMRRT